MNEANAELIELATGVKFTQERRRRFWGNVAVAGEDECWEWQGRKNKTGYGSVSYGQISLAHRLSFVIFYLKHPPVVMHTCDNRACVNPHHLVAGDLAWNIRDMVRKGRVSRGPGSKSGRNKLRPPLINEKL